MGAENDIFWSEIGSGFKELGGTPLPSVPRSTPLPLGIIVIPYEVRYDILTIHDDRDVA